MVLNRVLSSASQLLRLNNPPQIVLVGHPTLRKPAKPIPIHEITSPKITSIINKMSSCFGKGLIGLAAPQVKTINIFGISLNCFTLLFLLLYMYVKKRNKF